MPYGPRHHLCPGCGEQISRQDPSAKKVGNWRVHPRCHPVCSLCDKELMPTPIGQSHTVGAWIGRPVHTACKRKEQS